MYLDSGFLKVGSCYELLLSKVGDLKLVTGSGLVFD